MFVDHTGFKIWIVIFILNSIVMTTLFCIEAFFFDYLFFGIQGVLINYGLLTMYVHVYSRFKAYHYGILEKYKLIFQDTDRK